MYNLHNELNKFYVDDVCLGRERRDSLASRRDSSLTRLESGLDSLGHPIWRTYLNQGGYAMHTLNQAADNNYDLDVALIFEEADLPSDAYNARQRIRNALIKKGGQFKEDPSARTNAVTVWYASGEHLDFAVFRRRKDYAGSVILEHASGDDWKYRDPEIVTRWFNAEVQTKSPSSTDGATVLTQQLRRVVRFVKFFARRRAGWTLPGGMITTALVCECYQADFSRDDASLYRTLKSLHFRLTMSAHVFHPTDKTHLTEKPKRASEVANFKALLDELMPRLYILESDSCTRAQARNAWRQFFNHEYWNADNDVEPKSLLRPAVAAAMTEVSFGNVPRVPVKPVGFG